MPYLVWSGILALLFVALVLDLGIFRRETRAIPIREALSWSLFWVVVALGFNAVIHAYYDQPWFGVGAWAPKGLAHGEATLQFFVAYLAEKSLVIGNIFVIAMTFAYFGIRVASQHRLLKWGILGILVLRGPMLIAGAALLDRFPWITYLFGCSLILTAVKLLVARHDNLEPDRNPLVRLLRRRMPEAEEADGQRFFTEMARRRAVTRLGICLVVIGSTNLIFAIDAIPAVLCITREPLLVVASNVFALLGLRSLYFALAGCIEHFRYLKTSLAFLVTYLGIKTLLSRHDQIPDIVSLAVIGGILSVGVLASIFATHRDTAPLRSPLRDELQALTRMGLRQARRIAILLIGSTVLLIGIAMLVLPGPGLLVIPAGLSILSLEFLWARRWLGKMQATTNKIAQKARYIVQRGQSVDAETGGSKETKDP